MLHNRLADRIALIAFRLTRDNHCTSAPVTAGTQLERVKVVATALQDFAICTKFGPLTSRVSQNSAQVASAMERQLPSPACRLPQVSAWHQRHRDGHTSPDLTEQTTQRGGRRSITLRRDSPQVMSILGVARDFTLLAGHTSLPRWRHRQPAGRNVLHQSRKEGYRPPPGARCLEPCAA